MRFAVQLTMSGRQPLLLERSAIDPDRSRTPFEITVFDTAVGSQNLGDQIISNAVHKMIGELFPHGFLWSLPTHDTFGPSGRKRQRHSLFSVTTGTNLLSRHFPYRGLWKIPRYFRPSLMPFGTLTPKNLVFCAVGSNASDLSNETIRFLNRSVWASVPISVRDKATEAILERAGFAKVLHTSCVTLWDLPRDHANQIPRGQARAAVVALTGTRRASHAYVEADRILLQTVRAHYPKRFFWPQGQVDLEYASMLGLEGFEILPTRLNAFSSLLVSEPSLDFVGARLHAGIHAIMHNRRSIVIAVDNRAVDIASSVSLPVIPSSELSARLSQMIVGSWPTELDIPHSNIAAWKDALVSSVRKSLSDSLNLTAFQPR